MRYYELNYDGCIIPANFVHTKIQSRALMVIIYI